MTNDEILTPRHAPTNNRSVANLSSPHSVRVFRNGFDTLSLQMRSKKTYTTVALRYDEAKQIAKWLNELAETIPMSERDDADYEEIPEGLSQ